jgi:hypothetical protein
VSIGLQQRPPLWSRRISVAACGRESQRPFSNGRKHAEADVEQCVQADGARLGPRMAVQAPQLNAVFAGYGHAEGG